MPQRGARAPETRARILAAATELVTERGYAATSVAQICQLAGVVPPALYWHFGSKQGLLGAIVDDVGNAWIDAVETRIKVDSEPEDPLLRATTRLNRALEGWQDLVVHHPHMMRVLMVVALERSGSSDEVREALKRFGRRSIDTIVSGIRDAIGRDLPDLDLLAHTVVSLVQGAVIRRLIDPEGTDVERLVGELRQTIALAVVHRVQRADARQAAKAAKAAKAAETNP